MIHREILAVATAAEAAIEVLAPLAADGAAVIGDHIRPDFIHVGGVGEVEHIRAEAAGGAHVDLQTEDVALFAQRGLIRVEHEKFQMHKAALHAESGDGAAADVAHGVRQGLLDVIAGVAVGVDDIHDGIHGDVAGFKQRLALGIDDRVIRVHRAVDELLHDVDGFVLRGEEIIQLVVAAELVGVGRAHAVIRLDDDGVADLADEILAAGVIAHDVPARGLDARLGVIGLHRGFILDRLHILGVEAGGDVEGGAQHRVALEPVFVVAFQPVDPAVLVGQKRDGAENLVVIFERGDFVIFVQRAAQLRHELVIRAIADAEDVHAVLFQLGTEFPIVRREIRGDKDKVFHGNAPLCGFLCVRKCAESAFAQ